MKLATIKTPEELRPVLKEPTASGPDPAYWVFRDIGGDWSSLTIIPAEKFGSEYPKTYGHYHSTPVAETSYILSGKGIILLQKKESGQITEVLLIMVKAGDKITVPPVYGHTSINTGDNPLLIYDNWKTAHQPADYEEITERHGFAFYLTDESGQLNLAPNTHYQNVPQPVWLTPEEFLKRQTADSGRSAS